MKTFELGKVVLGKLVAKTKDVLGYITYVFELIEESEIERLDTKYIMCTRFPNWEHRIIDLEEIGYLQFVEIIAGISSWFDGNKMIPYRYNNIQFIKFIEKQEKEDYKYKL